MPQRALTLLTLAALVACERPPSKPAAPPAGLGASERLFVARDAEGELLVGAQANHLWVATAGATSAPRWQLDGDGVAQAVALGDFGRGRHLYVAWGRGRDFLAAPIVLSEVDVQSGHATELWRQASPRADVALLAIADVNRDGKRELAFAYFDSKYRVRPRHLTATLEPLEGPSRRMATSWAYGDVDGDGIADEVVGRLYGDDIGVPGDLHVDLGKGPVPIAVDRGVRALSIASLAGEAPPSIYFADGWEADYARRAKAELGRAHWEQGHFVVERLGVSPDEFMFQGLEAIALGRGGALLASGNRRLTLFLPAPRVPWAMRAPTAEDSAPGGVIVRAPDGALWLYQPGPATRGVRM